jgi:predicted glutamine amidotransferase
MCRLFALTASPRCARAAFWLLDAPDSLVAQSYHNPDGVGLGWFDPDGQPQSYRHPDPAYQDSGFAREAHTVCSTTFVAHVRHATAGGRTEANTHPFSLDGRLFAHNGVIEDVPALEQELAGDLARVVGETDSERFFALVTREIAAHGGDVGAGIASAAGWVAAHLPLYSLNFVMATPSELWALRYPASHELHVLDRPEIARAQQGVAHTSSLGMRVSAPDVPDGETVVIASERMDEELGWRALDPGELVHVRADRTVASQVILPDPPAHPLTLDDLGAVARVAQQPG